MKKQVLTSILMLNFMALIAQSIPQGNPPANNTNAKANAAWYRGGNNMNGTNPPDANLFGTLWNSPIYTMTNNQVRSVLMGNYTDNYLGTGYLHDVSGFMGIGLNNYFVNHVPLTMLHLEGPNNTSFIGGQWRNWIRQWADT